MPEPDNARGKHPLDTSPCCFETPELQYGPDTARRFREFASSAVVTRVADVFFDNLSVLLGSKVPAGSLRKCFLGGFPASVFCGCMCRGLNLEIL